MDDKLLHCPFCGGEARILTDMQDTTTPVFSVVCDECESITYFGDVLDKEGTVEAWNNRPSPWHTGKPTENGCYLLECKIGNSENTYFTTDHWSDTVGYWTVNGVIRWQKI